MAEQIFDLKDSQGNPYKIRATSQEEAVQKLLQMGPGDMSPKYLKDSKGMHLMRKDGSLIEDPREPVTAARRQQQMDTLTDPKKLVPAATELVGEAGGTLLGGMNPTPSQPVTAIGLGAVGAGGGRMLGEKMVGTPTEEAWAKSKEAALWSAAGGGLFEGARLFRGWFGWGSKSSPGFAPPLKPSEIALLKEMRPEYEDIARQIGAAPRADQLRDWNVIGPGRDKEEVGLVRKVGDTISAQSNVDDEARRVAGDYEAIYKYLAPNTPMPPGYMHESGIPFDVAISQEYDRVTGKVEGELKNAQRNLAANSAKIPGLDEAIPTGIAAGARLQELATTAKAEVDSLYDTYRQAIGQTDGAIPRSSVTVEKPEWFNQYAKDILDATKDETLTANQRQSFNAIKNAIFTKDDAVDLAALDDAIIQQGRRVSMLKANTDPGVSLTRETNLLSKLKQWREEAGMNLSEEANAAYLNAQKAYGEYEDQFGKGLVGSLLSYNKDGSLILNNPTPLLNVFKSGDIAAINQLQTLANKDVGLKSELRKLAFAHYRANVIKDGVVDLNAHEKYMSSVMAGGYKELTQGFFDKKDWALIQRAGGYAKVMLEKEQALKKLQEQWSNALGGRLATLDDVSPQRFVTMLFPTAGGHKVLEPQHADYLMKILKKYDPSMVPAYEDAVRKRVLTQISNPETKELSLSKLSTLLNEGTTSLNLKAVLGSEYIDRLQRVVKYMQNARTDRILPGPVTTKPSPISFETGRKAFFGQLSTEGYRMGILGGMRKWANEQALYRALTDPQALKDMEKHYARMAFGYLGANTGGLLLLRPEDEANE